MDELHVPDTAQHYIECDIKSCRNFSEFYCNTCHQGFCGHCKQRHLVKNKGHEIVLYQEKKRKLPSEKCMTHPTQDIDIYCDDCQNPICSTCFTQHHGDHEKCDLENIYNEILQQCQREITEIWKKAIPGAKNNVKSILEKRDNVKKEIAKVRFSMKKRADEMKDIVDNILTDNNKILDEIENSVLNIMVEHQKEIEDYIKYLEKMIVDYESKMSSINPTELIKFHLDISLATVKMPNKAKPELPIFTVGTLNKKEISKQFGGIELESSAKFQLSSVTKESEIAIQGHAYHLSPLALDKFWASDVSGYLIQYEGNVSSNNIHISSRYFQGNHSVTTQGELLCTDNSANTVYRVTNDMSINKLIETGKWIPGAIYSSLINEHILVGMEKNKFMRITRYSREGKKLQDIQWDDKGQNLYQSIYYLTENINCDIWTSDLDAAKVVVVTATGEYRFSYSGHHSQSGFHPYGICANVLGHVLVCNGFSKNYSSVHLLDINGQFLTLLLTPEQCPSSPCALCIDDQHNLWVGRRNNSTVSVFKYLHKT
ncbi:uncharacterized protein LOC134270722 [Saccostrea cucullata]|uniref:uncharacterized protein LOC134270722 n=1 Tax=Saccostrea cuccullata TaxID=36930 RepID=UPI002ED22288